MGNEPILEVNHMELNFNYFGIPVSYVILPNDGTSVYTREEVEEFKKSISVNVPPLIKGKKMDVDVVINEIIPLIETLGAKWNDFAHDVPVALV